MARGDFFNSKVASFLLHYISILPVFRKEEGKELLYKNQETFSYCISELKRNGAIVIFSEGICENEWDLRPLRKGTARLAFEAWSNPDIGDKLKVVPVAIHYSSWLKSSPRVYVEFLKNIENKSFTDLDEGGFFNKKFNEQLRTLLAEKCIVVNKDVDTPGQNKLIGFALKNFNNGNVIAKKIQDKYLTENDDIFKSNHKKLSEFLLKENMNYYKGGKTGAIYFLLSVLIYVVAYILNALPYYISRFIVQKNIKDTVFHDSVMYSILMVVYPMYIIVIYCVAKSYLNPYAGFSLVLLTILSASLYEGSKRTVQYFLKKQKMKTVSEMLNRISETNSD